MHLKQISRELRRKLYGPRAEFRGGGYYGAGANYGGYGGGYDRHGGGYGGMRICASK